MTTNTSQPQSILVTGGVGYIGSHTCVCLLESGYDVTILDNLSNSHPDVVRRIEKLTGGKTTFVEGDIRDERLLIETLKAHQIDAVMHFAGLKAVGESVEKPLMYYDNNVGGTLSLLTAMATAGVHNIVFSSSATVYGDPASVPIREDFPRAPTNPYGRSKMMIEDILLDLCETTNLNAAILRYFNPVGAHPSGDIGEDPQGIPNNLMPYISQVAIGRREKLAVFGNDYPTPDGTGVRDYIHVCDLAEGHIAALRYLDRHKTSVAVNLGTGRGYSVLEMVAALEAASGKNIPHEVVARRRGDIAACYADTALATRLFDWRAKKQLSDMCADTWKWQQKNPQGYDTC